MKRFNCLSVLLLNLKHKHKMKHLLVVSGLLLAASTAVASNFVTDNYLNNPHGKTNKSSIDEAVVSVEDIHIIELEETIDLGFNVNQYLPENFNPLAGKDDINWKDIPLIEIPENVDLDTKIYLPKDFNPLKGKDDINWSKVSLIEIDEDVQFNFNTQDYLPTGFNPNK
tara:strand:- start:45514 stop:46020 length:507 start_codon:yes stop_codon:yes gene_type:complete